MVRMPKQIPILDRKLLRDLWEMKGQALAIAAVVAAGVTMFVMYLSNFDSLRRTRDEYYETARFADVFATLKRAPASLAAANRLDSRRRIGVDPGRGRRDARRAGNDRAGDRTADFAAGPRPAAPQRRLSSQRPVGRSDAAG